MRALRESTVQVGAPTCTLLGYVASAKNPEYRLAAAEAIAALFEAGLLDTGTFAETLKWALEDGKMCIRDRDPNPLTITRNGGNTTYLDWDKAGHCTAVTDASGFKQHFTYDDRGQDVYKRQDVRI